MASVNKVIIVGHLSRDPQMRYMPNGDAIANIAVATSYRSKDRPTGEQKDLVEWHRIALFGRLAEIVTHHLRKGSSTYIEGRLQTRKYADQDGIERYATDIICENMQMLGGSRPKMAPIPSAHAGGTQPDSEAPSARRASRRWRRSRVPRRPNAFLAWGLLMKAEG